MDTRARWLSLVGVCGLVNWNVLGAAVPVYVHPESPRPEFPYATWETAARTIQPAVDVANDGREHVVRIAAGRYALSRSLIVTNDVVLETASGLHDVVVDGQTSVRCLYLNAGDARVRNLVLRNGWAGGAAGTADACGGGAYVDAGILAGCVIDGCRAAEKGGGAYVRRGGLQSCTVTNNVTVHGGGLYLEDGAAAALCRVMNNTASLHGGGVYGFFGGILANCLVSGNVADSYGGGVFLYKGGELSFCTVCGNRAGKAGGGLQSDGTAGQAGHVAGSILYGNAPDDVGGSAPRPFTNCCTTAQVEGSGNFAADPLFADRGDTYHLAPGSPCINRGGARVAGAEVDLDVDRRPACGLMDVGADECARLPLWCDIAVEEVVCGAPCSVRFRALVDGRVLGITDYRWDFDGDGIVDAELGNATVWHDYPTGGVYTVTLTVVNSIGETASCTRARLVTAPPPTRYVAPGGGSKPPYDNWLIAARDLATALAACQDGDRIVVSNATYLLDAPVALDQAVEVVSLRGAAATVLDAQYPAATNRCVVFSHAGAVLDGFTLRGGRATHGGGVEFTQPGMLRNCRIVANSAVQSGGGVRCVAGSVVSNCHFEANVAGASGGAVFFNGGGTLADSVVYSNRASHGGGTFGYVGGTVDRSTVWSNRATSFGGGCYVDRAGTIRNSLVDGNRADAEGGGLYLHRGGLAEHCTVAANTAAYFGGGVSCVSNATVRNSIVYDNAAPEGPNHDDSASGWTYEHCCTAPLPAAGTGNFTNAPAFVASGARNYRLRAGSRCIDHGSADAAPPVDRDGVPRPLEGDGRGVAVRDVGAYEFVDPAADTDADGLTDAEELAVYGTSPVNDDSDGDGIAEGKEMAYGTDPARADSDGDGLSDYEEIERIGSDPLDADSDDDGVADGAERDAHTRLLDPDFDNDGLSDGGEALLGSQPRVADSDGDGFTDGAEALAGTDPLDPDNRLAVEWRPSESWWLNLAWVGARGRLYTVDQTASPRDRWMPVPGWEWLRGTGGRLRVEVADDLPSAFYRVRVRRDPLLYDPKVDDLR